MKKLVLAGIAAVLLALPAAATAARSSNVVVSAVSLTDRTCLRISDPSGELSSSTLVEWKIIDPSGAVYFDPLFADGWTFYSGVASDTWACIDNSVLAARGSGWTATVKIARQGRATQLAFF